MNKSSKGLLQINLTETSFVNQVNHIYERQFEISRSEFHEMVKLQYPFVADSNDIEYCYARIFKAKRKSKRFKKFERLSNDNIGILNYCDHYIAFLKYPRYKTFPVWHFRIEINEEPPKVESEATK